MHNLNTIILMKFSLSNRCSVPTSQSGVYADNTQKNDFVDDSSNSKFYASTPDFKVFEFVGNSGVQFKCTIRVCATGDDRCDVRTY